MQYQLVDPVTLIGRFTPGRTQILTAQSLQFTAPSTITWAGGDFAGAGWASGMHFRIEGSASNDNDFEVDTAGTTTLTVAAPGTVTNEGPVAVRMGGQVVAKLVNLATGAQLVTTDLVAAELANAPGIYTWPISKLSSVLVARTEILYQLQDLVTGLIQEGKIVVGGFQDDIRNEVQRIFQGNQEHTIYYAVSGSGAARNVPDGSESHIRVRVKDEAASDWSSPEEEEWLVFTYLDGAVAGDRPASSLSQTTQPTGTFTSKAPIGG